MISWTLQTPAGIGAGPITVTVTSPRKLSITLPAQRTREVHSTNLLAIFSPVVGAKFLIFMDITDILETPCAAALACTLFHENTVYVDPVTNTTHFPEFEWGIADGTFSTAFQGRRGNTLLQFMAADTAAVPRGTWRYRVGCLVPLTAECPMQEA